MAAKWLKKGKDAQQAVDREKQIDEDRKNEIRRFWLPKGKETRITFLDGDLDENGLLDVPIYYEHNMFMSGKWGNTFVCTTDEGTCPLCESGDKPAFVAIMTVIDHAEFESKAQNKKLKDQVRLFVCKRDTYKMLTKIATKRGGLAGATFEASRSDGDKSPAVGDMFDFEEKKTVAQVITHYKQKPLDYEKVLPYKTEDELRALGFGEEPVSTGGQPTGKGSDYEDDL